MGCDAPGDLASRRLLPRRTSCGPGGPTFYEVWNTRETPAVIDRQSGEPAEEGLVLGPPPLRTRIRVIDFPPEDDRIRNLTPAEAAEKFGEMGDAEAARAAAGAPHPLMHRTQTIDYGIVIEGELTLVVDEGETKLGAGDIVTHARPKSLVRPLSSRCSTASEKARSRNSPWSSRRTFMVQPKRSAGRSQDWQRMKWEFRFCIRASAASMSPT